MVSVMRIGITGGRGFIGSAVKHYFQDKGLEIIDYDCNLGNLLEIENMFSKHGFPDVIVHLAGRFSGQTDVLLRDNLLSTNNLLSALAKHPDTHLIFGSSGAVYGNSGSTAINESTVCIPNTEYGLLKSYCEQSIAYYGRSSGLESTLLRFPSVYGSNNSKGIIFNWVQGALLDRRIVIHGKGTQRRSFIDVLDICDAIYTVINKRILGTYNVSHAETYDLNELSELFQDVFNVDVSYEGGDNALESMILDSSKLQSISSWQPSRELKSHLESYLSS